MKGYAAMNKKDFELIARVLKDALPPASNETGNTNDQATVFDIADGFAQALKHTNPRFDYVRFLNACGHF